MKRPEIRKECVETLLDRKFIRVYDLQYEEGRHYFDASRREKDALIAVKTAEELRCSLPDAVSCFVILKTDGEEDRLLLTYEYRYPTGQFLLSIPAGLIDAKDVEEKTEDPRILTAIREIREETGLSVGPKDKVRVLNPCAFSSPGMTDESNALVLCEVHADDLSALSQTGAEGSECFDGFLLCTREKARELLRKGCDDNGIFYSMYTFAALLYFAGGESAYA